MRSAAALLVACFSAAVAAAADGASNRYRLTWTDDPTSTMTIGWCQEEGTPVGVEYGTSETLAASEANNDITTRSYDNTVSVEGQAFNNYFVTLTDLSPDTAYYFRVNDSLGSSEIMWFKTAPDTPSDFTFIAGGDTRTNDEPRRWGMELVSRIRPLFILFGADYMDDGANDEWRQWLDDWQATMSDDGRMYPIVTQHGNHENDVTDMVQRIFNTPNADMYGTLGFGNGQFRMWTLNTELEPGVGYGSFTDQDSTKWDAQEAWLDSELSSPSNYATWQVANYHRPMRPHTGGKSEGTGRIEAWAQKFYDNGVDLVIESDSHMVKYTFPLVPDTATGSFQDFSRNDTDGTMFIGEGSWGAPTRPIDDDKTWTLDSDSFWQYKLIHVHKADTEAPDGKMEIRTVKFGSSDEVNRGVTYDPTPVDEVTQAEQDADPFAMPAAGTDGTGDSPLDIWQSMAGEALTIYPNDSADGMFRGDSADVDQVQFATAGDTWQYLDDGSDQGTAWRELAFDDNAWSAGRGQFGYGDGDEDTVISFGGDPDNKYITSYFRKEFTVPSAADIVRLRAMLVRDDGVVAYINGTEAFRSNMPEGAIGSSTLANSQIGGSGESEYSEVYLDPALIQDGANILAVELHQGAANSSDTSFDMALIGTVSQVTGPAPAAPTDLVVTPISSSQLDLTWTDNATDEVGYELWRKVTDGAWKIYAPRLDPNLEERSEIMLAEDTEYTYKLRAYNQYGLSTFIGPVSGTTLNVLTPVVGNEDFQSGTLGSFSPISVSSNADWEANEHPAGSGEWFASNNGYGADEASDDWLISGPLNLWSHENEYVTADLAYNYSGPEIEVLFSTDYKADTHADPGDATWWDMNPSLPSTGGYTFESMGELGFSRFSEDFESDTLGGFTPVSRASNADWNPETRGDQKGAVANGFGADGPSDDWLIAPTLALPDGTDAILDFQLYRKYDGPELEVMISTDYQGGDPIDSGATWDSVLIAHDHIWDEWKNVRVDLAEYSGDVTVAFRYTSTGTGSGDGARLGLDDVSIIPNSTTAYVAFRYTSTGTGGGDGRAWQIDNFEFRGDRTQLLGIEEFEQSEMTESTWMAYSVTTDDKDWYLGTEGSSEPQNGAFGNNYGEGNDTPVEDWLISPQFTVAANDNATLLFDFFHKYTGELTPDMELMVSKNYSGSGDPRAADWNSLGTIAENDEFYDDWEPRSISLGSWSGSLNLAYVYTGLGAGPGDSARLGVDNVRVVRGLTADPVRLYEVSASVIGTHATGIYDESAAEIGAWDPSTNRFFVTNSNDDTVDVLDLSDPTNPTRIHQIDISAYGDGVNSVAVSGGVLAAAVESGTPGTNGTVEFFATNDYSHLGTKAAGDLPDMVTFTPNGKYVLVANEGEPNDDYTVDPEGSVTIIDISGGISEATPVQVGFTDFNAGGNRANDLPAEVRITGPGASVAQDFEPEYIAVSSDSAKAYVSLQENNAMAIIDIATGTVDSISALGSKDHNLPGNGLDANKNDDNGVIEQLPISGLYMPDALAAFEVDGNTYIISANEGDGREYEGNPGHVDETDLKDVTLDAAAFDAGFIGRAGDTDDIGDLTIIDGMGNTDADADLEEIYTYGARSFSIWSGADGSLVYDSGDWLERITVEAYPNDFNSDNDENGIDGRSDNKGPEPEAVTTAVINERTYAFVGLERIGGVVIVDVTDPTAPIEVQYINNRDFSKDPETELAEVGDLGPEGIVIIPADQHPTGAGVPLMVVTNEVSGTTTVYELAPILADTPEINDLANTYENRPEWRWNPVKGAAGYVVAMDGGAEESIAQPRYEPGTDLAPGTHTLTVWAVDADGVRSQPNSGTVTINEPETYVTESPTGDVRIATFNAYLNRSSEGKLLADLNDGEDSQAQAVAEILQRVRPDVVLLNEFDYVGDASAVEAFQDNYLSVSQNGAEAITYEYVFVAPVNTGVQPDPAVDFNNDGTTGGPDDAYGYGAFPGQYGMVLLSQYPIDTDGARTFQEFLWKDMPGALLPDDPDTANLDNDWYSAEELEVFRLSSKSHWDVPVLVGEERIHLLCSHPTPPVFDGDEDRNGKRNFDEIRFWKDYVSGEDDYIYDDDGTEGGIPDEDPYVVLGDQNASPVEGDGYQNAIGQLLFASAVSNKLTPESLGGVENDPDNPYSAAHTADWKMRADYVLPSSYGVIPENAGVFWPRTIDDLYYLVGPDTASSDHRLVWMDMTFGEPAKGETVVESRIAAGDDDAEELAVAGDPENGKMDVDSSDLELVEEHPGDGDTQTVGLRFRNVAIPDGAKILEAYIQFAQDEDKSAAPFSLMIAGEAADHAEAYVNETGNITSRTMTQHMVTWEGDEAWDVVNEASMRQATPNLAPVVQEIVDRDGWSSGNPVAFVIEGEGTRCAESYDGDPELAPKLRIVYTMNYFCAKVAASDDDAEELTVEGDPENGKMDVDSSDLELVEEHPGDGDIQTVGLRFRNVAIPDGAHIVDAYIQFAQDEDKSAAPFELMIAGEAADNAAAYENVNGNITSRSKTMSHVIWDGDQPWDVENEAGERQRTPNLAAVVQEVIARPGWTSGNAIAFVVAGSGTRCVESYDGDPELAPKLCVEYSMDGTKVQVAAGNDDVEELTVEGDPENGKMDVDSSDLEMVEEHPGDGDVQTIGIRFANVAVPDGVRVAEAYLQFAQDEDKSAAPFELTIAGEAADNAASFSSDAFAVTSRATTDAEVKWEGDEAWDIENEAGMDQRSPNLAPVVQEIISRDGWSSGNAIAFVITGSGTRCAESYDGDPELAPTLKIRWSKRHLMEPDGDDGEEEPPVTMDKFRLVWNDDPATTMTVAWDQLEGSNAAVYYGTEDQGQDWESYPDSQAPTRATDYRGMKNHFAKLTGLSPDTAYYFVVKDDMSVSERMWFRTAPDTQVPFTFISGADTKSMGDAYKAGVNSLKMVPKLRPLFIEFNGDFCTGDGTNDVWWAMWLRDWHEHTMTEDGRMFPILPAHGNHENGDFEMLNKLFDTPTPDAEYPYSYYSLSFADDLLKIIVLNSEIDGVQAAWNAQMDWLEQELINSLNHTFTATGYHKPVRPHTTSKNENDYLWPWADLFYEYGVDLSFDSDSHIHKITFPIRPCINEDEEGCWEGYVRDDENGTMYVGEGSWGAWSRLSDDAKPWTMSNARMQQFKWLHVYPAEGDEDARIEIRTVVTGTQDEDDNLIDHVAGVGANSESDVFAIPANLKLLEIPGIGDTVEYPFVAPEGEPPVAPEALEAFATSYSDIVLNWENPAGDNAASLYLERKMGEDGEWTVLSTNVDNGASKYHLHDLRDGTDYYFRMKAINIFGFSSYSNVAKATTPMDTRVRGEFQFGRDGYADTVDIELNEEIADQSMEGETSVTVDNNSANGDRHHILLRFNGLFGAGEGQVPPDAEITRAELKVWVVSNTDTMVSMHRMLEDWEASETWNSMQGGVSADDVQAVADPEAQTTDTGDNLYLRFDVTNSVDFWQENPDENFGWGFRNAGSDGWDFTTSEYGVMEKRPLLTIFYKGERKSEQSIQLDMLGTYKSGIFDESAAEIGAFDPMTNRFFVVNGDADAIDVLDMSDPTAPTLETQLSIADYGDGINSVAIGKGFIAAAVEVVEEVDGDEQQRPGKVVFFDSDTLEMIGDVTVGYLPDMVALTPNKKMVLVANEGEPNEAYTADPEGSVSIIDVSDGVANAAVTNVDFTAFNQGGERHDEINLDDPSAENFIRIFGPGATVAQDLEPEYIAVSADGTTAYVAMQENNATAIIDIMTGEVNAIVGLGLKDHGIEGNGLDANKEDNAAVIKTQPLMGMYQPDAIAGFVADKQYLITANEGDSRDYDGFSEETDVEDANLDEAWDGKIDEFAGLTITNTLGDTDGDGDLDDLYAYGARSFSIWDGKTGELVYDSGDWLERITAEAYPNDFNSDNDENGIDGRSDNKGPEPEAVAVAQIGTRLYAFVGLERIGGVAVFEITNPQNPQFIQYVNNRNFSVEPGTDTVNQVGDLGPEGIVFIPGHQSPHADGLPLLVVTNEVSGTTTVYVIDSAWNVRPEVADLGTVNTARPTWDWEDVEGAEYYSVVLDANEPVDVQMSEFTPMQRLTEGMHEIRVKAVNAEGVGSKADTATATVALDDADQDLLPDDWEQKIVDADNNDDMDSIEDVLPDGDFDNDGISNADELADGTNPMGWVWVIDVDGASENYERLEFGMRAGAADGEDEFDVDAPMAPPADEAGIVFYHLRVSYTSDIRDIQNADQWFLMIQAGTREDVVLHWDNAGVLGNSRYLSMFAVDDDLRAVNGSYVNMKRSQQVRVPAGEMRTYVIRFGDELSLDLSFEKQWNLISIPFEPSGDARLDVLFEQPENTAPVSARALRDGQRGTIHTGEVWKWTNEGLAGAYKYDPVTRLDAMTGYWVYCMEPANVTITGTPIDSPAMELMTGWNLVGVPQPAGIPSSDRHQVRVRVWRWNAESSVYDAANALFPSFGYWINAAADDVNIPFGELLEELDAVWQGLPLRR